MSGLRETGYEHHETQHQYNTTGGGLTGGLGAGTTGTGEPLSQKITRKAGEAWEGAKEAMPGTAEHRATHPTTGGGYGATGVGTGMGTGMGATGMGTGMGTTGATTTGAGYGTHGVGQTGTGEPVGQKISRKAGEAWEGMKEAMPGTAEHKATHGTGGTGTGAMGTTEYHHTSRTNI